MTDQESTAFCQEVSDTSVTDGQLRFWWLGQQSWIVKTRSAVIGLDLYLSPSPHRLVPPLFLPQHATFFDVVCSSHDHSDHLDRAPLQAIAEVAPRTRFVFPSIVRHQGAGVPVAADRARFLDGRDACMIGAVRIVSIPSAHELLELDAQWGAPALGFLIYVDGFCLYHSGDTCCYEGLLSRLQQESIDVAMLPINGRDATRLRRGCIGNMTYQEAVDLAGLLRPGLVCPAHHGMFAGNTCDPQLFIDYLEVKFPGQRYWVGAPGTGMLYERDAPAPQPARALDRP